MSEKDDLMAIHDVAHTMICAKSRLRLPEYGLGADPANNTDAQRVVSEKYAQREEDLTCLLHWTFGAYLFGKKGAREIYEYLNMDQRPTLSDLSMFRSRFQLPDDYRERVLDAYPP